MGTGKGEAMVHGTDQRVCARVGLRRPVLLASAHGTITDGMLVDASLGGVQVEVAIGTGGFSCGQALELRLAAGGKGASYRCTVVRTGDAFLGLALDRQSAARFGLELTRGAFQRSPAPTAGQ
jgi:hypothetical protein